VVPWQRPAVDVMFSVVVRATGVVKFIESTQMSIKFKNTGHCVQEKQAFTAKWTLEMNCLIYFLK